jgi:hypothetical protein
MSPNRQRKQAWERTKFYNLYSKMGLYCRNPEAAPKLELPGSSWKGGDFSLCDVHVADFRSRMCILARILPYFPSDKLLDLSAGRGVVFTGLWVCKVLVVAIWVVPERELEYGLVAAMGAAGMGK